MSGFVPGLLHRSMASRALDVVKMRQFTPCDVDDELNNYHNKIVEVVYDPVRVPEVNRRFTETGYCVPEDMQVIAVNEDGSILLWGGLNSVFHLRPGETIEGAFDEEHLAFNDILDLTARFKIKNKMVEIDALIEKLRVRYGDEE